MTRLGFLRRWASRETMSIREIAFRTGLARNTVYKYLAAEVDVPRYAKRVSPSKLDAYAKLSMLLQKEVTNLRKQRRKLRQIHTSVIEKKRLRGTVPGKPAA